MAVHGLDAWESMDGNTKETSSEPRRAFHGIPWPVTMKKSAIHISAEAELVSSAFKLPFRRTRLSREKDELCQLLIRTDALKFGNFILTSGKLSPYYIDLRIFPSFPEAFSRVIAMYLAIIKREIGLDRFQRVAGIPVAGLPFASTVAYELRKPLIYVRKEAKLHGRERRVEGVLNPGDHVLLVDDLITTGSSLVQAADAVTSEGGVVKDAVVLIDRMENGGETLLKRGVKLHYLTDIQDIAKTLHRLQIIDSNQYKAILKQVSEAAGVEPTA